MKTISVFISYSNEEKEIAGLMKLLLEKYCGYEVFLAHDDMTVSADFQEEIMRKIFEADYFIPLISEKFSLSPYTDQEIGIAIAHKKKIIPIKLGQINPYGFIQKYHALQLKEYSDNTTNIKELVIAIGLLAIKSYSKQYSNKAKNSTVIALKNSNSFKNSNVIIQILCECSKLSKIQIEVIKIAIKTNYEVQEAFGLEDLKKMLKNKYKIDVD